MSHNQKSQSSEIQGSPRVQTESLGLVGESAITSSSTSMVLETTVEASASPVGELFPRAVKEEEEEKEKEEAMEEVSTTFSTASSTPMMLDTAAVASAPGNQHGPSPISPQVSSFVSNVMGSSLHDQFNQAFRNQEWENMRFLGNPIDFVSLQHDEMALMPYLIFKYWMKQWVTKAEMLNYIIPIHHHHFHIIFSNTCLCMRLLFGVDIEEVDHTIPSYELSLAAGITYDGIRRDVQGLPKTGLLLIVLSIIFMEGNRAREEVVWQALNIIEVYAGREHCLFGDPWNLIMGDFIEEGYLEYCPVPLSNPVCYEFIWGPRAYAETSKLKILQHCAQFGGIDPVSFSALYEEAVRDEQRRHECS
ncbi:melanoma-associated antigen 8-like [Perognathus longimembris pacificus]|uniref:melanoma-associated antigen 8-like n=1 Tax=Perognathus longimembris pacificus TaxID=214514 RepID=UPI00201919F0|nr:melanoma-associated antigen 8-like [Perognathus longimembris pacificus]